MNETLAIISWVVALVLAICLLVKNHRLQRVKKLLQERQQKLRGVKLTANQVEDIEITVSQDTVAEVRRAGEGLIVTKRPAKEHNIQFPFPIQCSESPCQLTMTLQKTGDTPVALGTVPLPANYWLEAIKGYRK